MELKTAARLYWSTIHGRWEVRAAPAAPLAPEWFGAVARSIDWPKRSLLSRLLGR